MGLDFAARFRQSVDEIASAGTSTSDSAASGSLSSAAATSLLSSA